MKQQKILRVLIVCLGILLVAAVGVLICGCSVGYVIYANADSYTAGDAEITAPVRELVIDWESGSVTIETHAENTVLVSEKDGEELSEELKLHYWLDGDVLRVRYCASGTLSFSRYDKELTVILPESLTLDRLDLDIASATAELSDISVRDLNLDTASGDVTARVRDAEKIEVDAASGNVTLTAASPVKDAEFDTASGRLELSFTDVEKLKTETASGNVTLRAQSVGDLSMDAASGDLTAVISGTLGEADFDTASGSVYLKLPDDLSFDAYIDTASGDVVCELPATMKGKHYTRGTDGAKIEIDTASGDVYLQPLA